MSYLFYKHYLHTHVMPPAKGVTQSAVHRLRTTKDIANEITEECERMIDAELDGTFPASDTPSWTMAGSVVSNHYRSRIGAMHVDALPLHFDQHS